jgi:ABC-2 type transport system ATP-binding protein
MERALKIEGLEMIQGQMRLGPINLDIEPGTSLMLLGPNGAGKSTLIHCVLGLKTPDAGKVDIYGLQVKPRSLDWKEKVGFVINANGFFDHLSIDENLRFIGSFYKSWDHSYCRTNLEKLNLDPKAKVSQLSRGQLAKLAFVAAISHRPKLLVMDEPTSGMDPLVKAEFLTLVGDHLRSDENALLMSSHSLSDVGVADRLAFLNDGRLIKVCDKDELLGGWRRISFRNEGGISRLFPPHNLEHDGPISLLATPNGEEALAKLKEAKVEVFDSTRMTLEDISVCLFREESK